MAFPLVEVADAPEGLVEIKVRDYWGLRIGFHQIRADDLDAKLIEDLKSWQARHAHCVVSLVPGADLIPPSEPLAGRPRCSESSP